MQDRVTTDARAAVDATQAAPSPGRTHRQAEVVMAYAAALIVYLPLEPALLAPLSGIAYWVLRLLPDALIALIALVMMVRPPSRPRTPYFPLMLGIGGAALILIALNALRGVPVGDSINALRTVLRYAVLGLCVWEASAEARVGRRIITYAVVATVLLQVGAGLIEVIVRTANGGARDPIGLWQISGSTGRYDRFGLEMAAGVIMAAALAVTPARHRGATIALVVLAGLCTGLAFLSTSRQALIGVALGSCAVSAVAWLSPRRPSLARVGLPVAFAVISLALVLAVPRVFGAPASAGDDEGHGAQVATPKPGPTPSASVAPSNSPRPSSSPTPTPIPDKAPTELSLSPNGNFRLYLTLVLAPWSVTQEPFLGLGPGRDQGVTTDPRLSARVKADGMAWASAQPYMNDSNYASLVIRFGLVSALLFGALLLAVALLLIRRAFRAPTEPLVVAAFGLLVAVATAAAFGPAFEIRMTSSLLWITAFAAIGSRRAAESRAI
jgi:hypothetical protein